MARQAKPTQPTVTSPPTASDLPRLLGDAHEAFQALIARHEGAVGEWKRYSKQSPWVLKVSQGERTLFYARPEAGAVNVTVILGGRAVEAALAGRVSKRLHASIRAARAYPEGRPVRVVVKSIADLARVEELVAVKLKPAATPGRAKSHARGAR
jgi:hypothetical protein